MERFKKVLFKLLFPHVALVAVLVPVAAALLIYAFAFEGAHPALVYASYALSAYALCLVCARAPRIISGLRRAKRENKYLIRYFGDAQLRLNISLNAALAGNIIYGLFQLGLGLYHGSLWFYALAAYYILLAAMRWALLKESRKNKAGENQFWEWLHYRFVGIVLLVVNLALAVIVAYVVALNRGFVHHYITTIALAVYTFWSFTMAIISIVRYRRYHSPLFSSSKAISLAAASVSLLTLETAMLSAFGAETGMAFRQIMTGATGTAVCIFVLCLAIYMIVHSTKEINRIKRNKTDE